MIETETLLEKCPRCGAWPMAAKLPKPSSPPEVRFRCATCGHQEFGRLRRPGVIQRRSPSPTRSPLRRRAMADDLETTVAPSAIERAMSIFEGS